jgi:hypothetical protein
MNVALALVVIRIAFAGEEEGIDIGLRYVLEFGRGL